MIQMERLESLSPILPDEDQDEINETPESAELNAPAQIRPSYQSASAQLASGRLNPSYQVASARFQRSSRFRDQGATAQIDPSHKAVHFKRQYRNPYGHSSMTGVITDPREDLP